MNRPRHAVRRFLLPLLVWTLAAPVASHGRPLILVDHSGSMAGFDRTNALSPALRVLRERIAGDPLVLWMVSDRNQGARLVPNDPPARYGADTRLYEAVQLALREYPRATSLWMLTDNQPSHERPDLDLEHLYDWLRGSREPFAVTLFVLKLPFDGPIYRASGARLDDDYRGDRALVLYATLLDRDATADFAPALDRVGAALKAGGPGRALRLRCKPLQEDSVEMAIESGTLERRPGGTLVGKGKEGQEFQGTFTVKVRSKLDHVSFENARSSFVVSKEFKTADFDTPRTAATLAQKDIEIGPGWTAVEAALEVGPVTLRRTVGSALKAFAKGRDPGVVDGELELRLQVDRKSVVILPEDVGAFSTDQSIFEDPSPAVQSRVYRLQELFQEKFVEDTLDLVPGRVPVRIEMAYSPISAGILVGVVIVPSLLLLVLGIGYWHAWGARYQLLGEGLDERPFRVRPARVVRGASGVVGTLRQFPPLFWFDAARGWEVEARTRLKLSRTGGVLNLRRKADGTRLRVRVNRVFGRDQAAGRLARRIGGPRPL